MEILHLATTLSDRQPYRATTGEATVFPHGMPLVYASLDRLRIASPAALTFINLASLSIGALALWGLIQQGQVPPIAGVAGMIAVVFSWVIVKHLAIPLTDIPFMGATLATVAVMGYTAQAHGLRRALLAVLAAALVVVCLSIRRNGVSLLPPLVCSVIPLPAIIRWMSVRARAHPAKTFLAAFLIVGGIAITGVCFFSRVAPPDMLAAYHRRGPWGTATFIVRSRALEMGELVLNTSSARFPKLIAVFLLIGALVAALLLLGLISRLRDLQIVDIYMICFVAIMLVWPYADARFWIALIPLLPIWLLAGFESLIKRPRWAAPSKSLQGAGAAFGVLFCLVGLAMHLYSMRISFSGSRFPERFGVGADQQAYRCVLLQSPPIDSLDRHEQQVARLLVRFGQKPIVHAAR